MSAYDDDPRVEALVREAAPRVGAPLPARERRAESLIGACAVAATAALALAAGPPVHVAPLAVVLMVAAYVAAKRVCFTIGPGTAVPTEAALVPMLLLLAPWLAVTLVVAGSVVDRLPGYLRGRRHPDHLLLHFGDAWHAIGAAAVLAAAAPGAPALGHWPVYLAAFAAQLVADGGSGLAREWLASGVPPQLQLRLLAPVFAVDAALAPIGLLIALTAVDHAVVLLAAMPLVGVLGRLAAEREHRIRHALALSHAYRGTALLMGEVLEADDPYTGGEHSKGVVALALAVGAQIGLDAREQRNLEFAALLHDIGKLRVPPEILNKPGPLTPEEWAVMRRHPADGQEMLERIGGALAEAGLCVRAHHERWDGGGYPDGLAGEEIPLPARIIAVCDSFNAMTTDRPYRAALPFAEAIAELRRCAGSQFDPRLVAAFARIAAPQATAAPELAAVAG